MDDFYVRLEKVEITEGGVRLEALRLCKNHVPTTPRLRSSLPVIVIIYEVLGSSQELKAHMLRIQNSGDSS